MPILVVVAFVLVVLVAAARANELFHLSVRDGRVLVVRGRIPVRLLTDIREIVARPPVVRATIRANKASGEAYLTVRGEIDDARAQRLRNVFGLIPSATLRTAPRIDRPTLGQALGIAWLAWLLDRR